MITVTTVLKTGSIYDYTWVDKLQRSLERHLKLPYTFVPISDAPHPYFHHTFIQDNPKYWNKLELFRPGLFTGKTLYFDLDTVITGDITEIVKNFEGSKFLMYEDRTHHSGSMSSIMYWEGDQSHLWNEWISQPSKVWYKKYAGGDLGDQAFIRDRVEHGYIQNKLPNQDNIFFATKREPTDKDIRIVMFAGPRRKPHLSDWNLVKREWI